MRMRVCKFGRRILGNFLESKKDKLKLDPSITQKDAEELFELQYPMIASTKARTSRNFFAQISRICIGWLKGNTRIKRSLICLLAGRLSPTLVAAGP